MKKPLLVYDADCGFCRRWVAGWKARTGDRVDYEPSETAAARLPDIPKKAFDASVWLIEPDRRSSGAEAVFRTLALGGQGGWLKAYEALPPFAAAAEGFYRLVARRRRLFSRLTLWLWGEQTGPPTYLVSRWLFLRLLGLCYLVAFLSLDSQILGLIGSKGVAPAAEFLKLAAEQLGAARFRLMPTVFWLGATDVCLRSVCATGILVSVLLMFGIAPLASAFLAWALYLSLLPVGQMFLSFQWDILLLETGFAALFLAPRGLRPGWGEKDPPAAAAVLLLRMLLFKLMFLSGFVKLASGDPAWRGLEALRHHYQTQPLPTVLAWWAHQLPAWFQKASCLAVFALELAVPVLFFAPRRPRMAAGLAAAVFMALIALTGNYCFFNLLAVALCLPLFDDAAFGRVRPFRAASRARANAAWAFAAFALWAGVFGTPRWAAPFQLASGYGLFAVMTTTRHEIELEGSADGREWRAYAFKWKPGDPARAPGWVAPHQPRLDWQMWFAALGPYQRNPWVIGLMARLIEGSPPVLGLLDRDPFPGAPPRYMRALFYEYRFTTIEERRASGAWWKRELKGLYAPPLARRDQRISR